MHGPRNHLSAINFTGDWFRLIVAWASFVIRLPRPPPPPPPPPPNPPAARSLGLTDQPRQPEEEIDPSSNRRGSPVRPGLAIKGVSPKAISSGPPRRFAPDAHRAVSSSWHRWRVRALYYPQGNCSNNTPPRHSSWSASGTRWSCHGLRVLAPSKPTSPCFLFNLVASSGIRR